MPSSQAFDTALSHALPPFLGQPGIQCADEDPEIFYPPLGEDTTAARQACRRCDHATACLEFALATYQRHGIWGGKTPAERARIITRLGDSR
jgi:WhiB family redox-sensing transcriptional regulator